MGSSGFSSQTFTRSVADLKSTGQQYARSATATATGNYSGSIADNLDPRKLKSGQRECCFAAGFACATPILVSIDGTGSMDRVPYELQESLPALLDLLTEQGVTDHPSVAFTLHDDEDAVPPDAAFQISQFETGAVELLASLNELVIPHNGGGNQGESYHLSVYAAANKVRLECFERDQEKGWLIIIGDEPPVIRHRDPAVYGTTPAVAKAVFGDVIEAEIPMLESLKKAAERWNVYCIRPGHTSHGKDASVRKMWRDMFAAAGIDTENVIDVDATEQIVPTVALTIGAGLGGDRDAMVQVLRTKGVAGVDGAAAATQALVHVAQTGAMVAAGTASAALVTSDAGDASGRARL
jgi:hypothetical protein